MDEQWQDWFEDRNVDPARDVLRSLIDGLDVDHPFIDNPNDRVMLIASKLARLPSSWLADPATVDDRSAQLAIVH